jgi:hypothetical protein
MVYLLLSLGFLSGLIIAADGVFLLRTTPLNKMTSMFSKLE